VTNWLLRPSPVGSRAELPVAACCCSPCCYPAHHYQCNGAHQLTNTLARATHTCKTANAHRRPPKLSTVARSLATGTRESGVRSPKEPTGHLHGNRYGHAQTIHRGYLPTPRRSPLQQLPVVRFLPSVPFPLRKLGAGVSTRSPRMSPSTTAAYQDPPPEQGMLHTGVAPLPMDQVYVHVHFTHDGTWRERWECYYRTFMMCGRANERHPLFAHICASKDCRY